MEGLGQTDGGRKSKEETRRTATSATDPLILLQNNAWHSCDKNAGACANFACIFRLSNPSCRTTDIPEWDSTEATVSTVSLASR